MADNSLTEAILGGISLLGLYERQEDENGGAQGSQLISVMSTCLMIVLFVVDFISTSLDWQVSFRLLDGDYTTLLRYMEVDGYYRNLAYGFYVAFMILSHVIFLRGKWHFLKSRDLFASGMTELALYSIEDVSTIFLFVYATGLFDPDNVLDRVNLIISNVSGYIVVILLWGRLLYACQQSTTAKTFRCNAYILPLWMTLEIALVSLLSYRTLLQKKWRDINEGVGYIDDENWFDFCLPIVTSVVTAITFVWLIFAIPCWESCLGLPVPANENTRPLCSRPFAGFCAIWTIIFSATFGLGWLLYIRGDQITEYQWVPIENELAGADNVTKFGHTVDWGQSGDRNGYGSSMYVASDSYCATMYENGEWKSRKNATGFRFCAFFGAFAGFHTNSSGTFAKLQLLDDCIIEGPKVEGYTNASAAISVATGGESSTVRDGVLQGNITVPLYIVVGYPYSNYGQGLLRVYKVHKSGERNNCHGLNKIMQVGPDILSGTGVLRRRLGSKVSMARLNGTIFVTTSRSKKRRPNAVSTFEFNGDQFVNVGSPLRSNYTNDGFGYSLELSEDGKTLIVGAPRNQTGRAFVYRREGSSWIPVGKPITPPQINGNDTYVHFGYAVSLSGDGSRIAAACDTLSHSLVFVFDFDESMGEWQLAGSPVESGNESSFSAGYADSLSMQRDGHFVAVGSAGPQSSSGLVRIYKFTRVSKSS